jgi:hypothetical protein
MQTFLPYPDFAQSAACLDNKRLGKQRVECLQILKALSDPSYGWQNHPAVKMWHKHDYHLMGYGIAICDEWIKRGFNDTCRDKITNIAAGLDPDFEQPRPLWLGNQDFHASHRSNLIRKDPVHYGQFGWTEPNNLPYVWPV